MSRPFGFARLARGSVLNRIVRLLRYPIDLSIRKVECRSENYCFLTPTDRVEKGIDHNRRPEPGVNISSIHHNWSVKTKSTKNSRENYFFKKIKLWMGTPVVGVGSKDRLPSLGVYLLKVSVIDSSGRCLSLSQGEVNLEVRKTWFRRFSKKQSFSKNCTAVLPSRGR